MRRVKRAVSVRITEQDHAVRHTQRFCLREIGVMRTVQCIVVEQVIGLYIQLRDIALRTEPQVLTIPRHAQNDIMIGLDTLDLCLRVVGIQYQQTAAKRTEPQAVMAVIERADVITRNDTTLARGQVHTQNTRRCTAPKGLINDLYIAHFHAVTHYLRLLPTLSVPTQYVHAAAVGSYIQRTVTTLFDIVYIRMIGLYALSSNL